MIIQQEKLFFQPRILEINSSALNQQTLGVFGILSSALLLCVDSHDLLIRSVAVVLFIGGWILCIDAILKLNVREMIQHELESMHIEFGQKGLVQFRVELQENTVHMEVLDETLDRYSIMKLTQAFWKFADIDFVETYQHANTNTSYLTFAVRCTRDFQQKISCIAQHTHPAAVEFLRQDT